MSCCGLAAIHHGMTFRACNYAAWDQRLLRTSRDQPTQFVFEILKTIRAEYTKKCAVISPETTAKTLVLRSALRMIQDVIIPKAIDINTVRKSRDFQCGGGSLHLQARKGNSGSEVPLPRNDVGSLSMALGRRTTSRKPSANAIRSVTPAIVMRVAL